MAINAYDCAVGMVPPFLSNSSAFAASTLIGMYTKPRTPADLVDKERPKDTGDEGCDCIESVDEQLTAGVFDTDTRNHDYQ
ncbi:hypothetical protein ColTof3_00166 [Colletotrichum tofieldiae]|nr:hypothetical protein ColTof3_00166 [Colletotrichum tofieldiae]